MIARIFFGLALVGLSGPALPQSNLSGTWMLDGPGTASEILLTEEGKRRQTDYDLLSDDPSLYWHLQAPLGFEQTPQNLSKPQCADKDRANRRALPGT